MTPRDKAIPDAYPCFDITVPDSGGFAHLDFGVGDGLMYAVVIKQPFDLWTAAVEYWPISSAVVLGLPAIIGALVMARILGRRQFPGQPHCRRCNYCLCGVSSDYCPECGQPQGPRGPVRGRTTGRRIILPLFVIGITIAIGSTLWFVGDPAIQKHHADFSLPIPGLRDLLEPLNIGVFKECRSTRQEFSSIDPATGRLGQPFYRCRGYMAFPPRLCPDRASFVVSTGSTEGGVKIVDKNDGSVNARIESDSRSSWGDAGYYNVLSISPDAQRVVLAYFDIAAEKASLVEWSVPDGNTHTLLDQPIVREAGRQASGYYVPQMFNAAGDGGGPWIAMPSKNELSNLTYPHLPVSMYVLANLHATQPDFAIKTCYLQDPTSFISPNAERIYVTAAADTFETHDLRTGRELPPKLVLAAGEFIGPTAFDPTSTRIGVTIETSAVPGLAVGNQVVRVYDADFAETLWTLNLPAGHQAIRLALSPHARYAAVVSADTTPAGKWRHHLLIYNLSKTQPTN